MSGILRGAGELRAAVARGRTGTGSSQLLPCGAGGIEGMGRRVRRDRVQPGEGSGATLGRVCEGIGSCPGLSAP